MLQNRSKALLCCAADTGVAYLPEEQGGQRVCVCRERAQLPSLQHHTSPQVLPDVATYRTAAVSNAGFAELHMGRRCFALSRDVTHRIRDTSRFRFCRPVSRCHACVEIDYLGSCSSVHLLRCRSSRRCSLGSFVARLHQAWSLLVVVNPRMFSRGMFSVCIVEFFLFRIPFQTEPHPFDATAVVFCRHPARDTNAGPCPRTKTSLKKDISPESFREARTANNGGEAL